MDPQYEGCSFLLLGILKARGVVRRGTPQSEQLGEGMPTHCVSVTEHTANNDGEGEDDVKTSMI